MQHVDTKGCSGLGPRQEGQVESSNTVRLLPTGHCCREAHSPQIPVGICRTLL